MSKLNRLKNGMQKGIKHKVLQLHIFM